MLLVTPGVIPPCQNLELPHWLCDAGPVSSLPAEVDVHLVAGQTDSVGPGRSRAGSVTATHRQDLSPSLVSEHHQVGNKGRVQKNVWKKISIFFASKWSETCKYEDHLEAKNSVENSTLFKIFFNPSLSRYNQVRS